MLTDFHRLPKRPPIAALVNTFGKASGAVGIPARPALTIDAMEQAAIKQSGGLTDFGSDSHHVALDALLFSLEHEARLNQLGRLVFSGMIIAALVSRLAVVDWEKRNPEVAKAPVSAPLIIVGMPRTGTTILYETLAAAPDHRAPLTWECRDYALAHKIENAENDPRITKLGKNMARMDRLMPGFSAIHYFDPFIPTECVGLTNLDLCSEQYPCLAWAPTYRKFLLSADFISAYEWHRRALRYLQATSGNTQWVLKTPMHSAYLGALLETYPDACLIHTHRDPTKVIASVCSLCATGRRGWSDHLDIDDRARGDLDYIAEVCRRATIFRNTHPEHANRFCDVAFEDFMTDPLAEIRRILSHFNRPLKDDQYTVMKSYLENRPRTKYGKHRYSLDQFSLSESDVRPLFSDYLERFGSLV